MVGTNLSSPMTATKPEILSAYDTMLRAFPTATEGELLQLTADYCHEEKGAVAEALRRADIARLANHFQP